MFTYSKTMLAAPDTSMKDYIDAEQGVERLRDGFAAYFQQYDALLLPVTPVPAHEHGPRNSPWTARRWTPST